MSRTTSKRQRYASAQSRRRAMAIRLFAITLDRERRRRQPPSTGPLAFLDDLMPIGWPYSAMSGSIGGLPRITASGASYE